MCAPRLPRGDCCRSDHPGTPLGGSTDSDGRHDGGVHARRRITTRVATDGTPLLTSYRLDIFPVGSTDGDAQRSISESRHRHHRADQRQVRHAPVHAARRRHDLRIARHGDWAGRMTTSTLSNTFARSRTVRAGAVGERRRRWVPRRHPRQRQRDGRDRLRVDGHEQRVLADVTAAHRASGNGTVGFCGAANTATSARTGTLTVAGQTFTVTQAGGRVHLRHQSAAPRARSPPVSRRAWRSRARRAARGRRRAARRGSP